MHLYSYIRITPVHRRRLKMTLSLNKINGKVIKRETRASADDEEQAWPEEEEAMINIKEGKVETEVQTSDDLIAELKDLENEP
jgi:hypothetical protein